MKYVVLVGDGMADYPIKEDNKWNKDLTYQVLHNFFHQLEYCVKILATATPMLNVMSEFGKLINLKELNTLLSLGQKINRWKNALFPAERDGAAGQAGIIPEHDWSGISIPACCYLLNQNYRRGKYFSPFYYYPKILLTIFTKVV